MKRDVEGPNSIKLKKDQIMCAAGEQDHGLYMIHSGSLMVFGVNGTVVTPLAILKEGQYFGEMSFFDHQPRSANVVALESTSLVKLTIDKVEDQIPSWLSRIAQSMARKLRESSELISQKGIRKKNVKTLKPLTIDEQRHYFQLLQEYLN